MGSLRLASRLSFVATATSVVWACGGSKDATSPATPPPPVVVARVVVTPQSDTLIVGDSVALQAYADDSAGHFISAPCAWKSSDTALASVTANGLVRTRQLGTVTVTATIGGKTGEAVLLVVPVIAILPRYPSMFAGDTVQLTVTVRGASGQPLSVPGTLVSRQPSVATVTAGGIVTGVAPGRAMLVASAPGAADSIVVAVFGVHLGVNREMSYRCLQICLLTSSGVDTITSVARYS